MEKRMEFVFKWAGEKLVVEDEDYKGAWPTIGDLYRDFEKWAAGKPLLHEIPVTTFGRHARNLAGIEVKRRSHAAIAIGVRLLADGDDGPTYDPKLKMRGPKLTHLERELLGDQKKAQRTTALEIAFAALTLISHADADRARQIANDALNAIHDARHRPKKPVKPKAVRRKRGPRVVK